jgi:hypothetical protein
LRHRFTGCEDHPVPSDDVSRENEDWLDYRFEYVSGVLELNQGEVYVLNVLNADGDPAPQFWEAEPWFRFYATNVGENAEAARVLFNDRETVTFDSGNLYIGRGDVAEAEFRGWPPPDPSPRPRGVPAPYPLVWARIFVTSKNVVPSFQYDLTTLGLPNPPLPQLTVSPADFAVFERHQGHRPPMPLPPISHTASQPDD